MKAELLVVGKTEGYITEVAERFRKRIQQFIPFEIKVLPEARKSKDVLVRKDTESKTILNQIVDSDYVVLLDEKGKPLTSVQFADRIRFYQHQSVKKLVFVIGGAYGFSEALYSRGNEKLSLSAMTYSHQVIRPMFLEQLYRAYTIVHNLPYHHQ